MNYLVGFGYSLAWALVKKLPDNLTKKLFQKFAEIAYEKDVKGVQQLRSNLSFMLDLKTDSLELENLVKEGMKTYFRYWQELFRLPVWTKNYVNQNIRIIGLQYLQDTFQAKKPFITAMPHMGNWDAAGFWYTHNFGELTTVAERLKPESLFKKFVKFRNAFGAEVIPTEGETDIFMQLIRRAKEGRMIALVADRDITKNGIEISYAKSKTTFPVGPAAIATILNGSIVPMSSFYDEKNILTLEFFPPLTPDQNLSKEENIKSLTQKLADIFEREIKNHPKDWHMLQKVWKDVTTLKRLNNQLVNK